MWVNAAASSARPPAGVIGRTTFYGLFGGRLRVDTRDAGALDAYVRGGRSDGPDRSSWTEGEAAWELGGIAHRLIWAARARAFGLDYSQPFDYRALGAALQPRVSTELGNSVLSLRGDLRHGSWSLSVPPGSTDTAATGTLALTGAALTLGRLVGPAWVEAGAESYRGAFDGWFTGALATASLSRGPFDLGVTARAWSTPIGAELGVSATAAFTPTSAATIRLEAGRYATDPLYGTPGSFGASLAVSVRVGSLAVAPRRTGPVELADSAAGGRKARFRLRLPHATSVAVAGDFTDWRPRPMARAGEDWLLELTVPSGVHHFAFLVNGRNWFVPEDAPGVSADEWGRRNATLVVDP